MSAVSVLRDFERRERVTRDLNQSGLAALVCALPHNVLMLTGYWPVVGTSLAVATRNGSFQILAPDDEAEIANGGLADRVKTFSVGSLNEVVSAAVAAREPLRQLASELSLPPGSSVGYESGSSVVPAPYVSIHLYGGAMRELAAYAFPESTITPADDLLARLRSVTSQNELRRVRLSCRIAEQAFLRGAGELRRSLTEVEAADLFRSPLAVSGSTYEGIRRAGGQVFCMSGPDSAEAYAAYQLSRNRTIKKNDLVLVHCNSQADGYWTDITRTFCFGEPDERMRRIYGAVFSARRAALDAIAPGISAAVVDKAARDVLADNGFGDAFRHGLGHGVGFAAIDHNSPPRLHPASTDILEPGMIFNIEPAIYLKGFGGIRHCDMVAITEEGPELLTSFQSKLEELIIE